MTTLIKDQNEKSSFLGNIKIPSVNFQDVNKLYVFFILILTVLKVKSI